MLKTAFDLSSIIWTSIIMYSTFASVVHGSMLERYESFYLVLGYLLPILLSLVYILINVGQYFWVSMDITFIFVGLILRLLQPNLD